MRWSDSFCNGKTVVVGEMHSFFVLKKDICPKLKSEKRYLWVISKYSNYIVLYYTNYAGSFIVVS